MSWLETIRREKGLSQKKVSEMVGIAQPSYWAIEHGKHLPSVETAKKIGAVLGFPWTDFFDGADREVG